MCDLNEKDTDAQTLLHAAVLSDGSTGLPVVHAYPSWCNGRALLVVSLWLLHLQLRDTPGPSPAPSWVPGLAILGLERPTGWQPAAWGLLRLHVVDYGAHGRSPHGHTQPT